MSVCGPLPFCTPVLGLAALAQTFSDLLGVAGAASSADCPQLLSGEGASGVCAVSLCRAGALEPSRVALPLVSSRSVPSCRFLTGGVGEPPSFESLFYDYVS